MPNPKLIAILTALLMCAGSGSAQAAYTLEQLRQIETYLIQRDYGALWRFLAEHPEILEGDDSLARELRVFTQAISRGATGFNFAGPTGSVTAPAFGAAARRIY
ncbi:hypothetical protein LV82_00210 [Albidovulum inexpectatum]|uniref:Uncharacterized protein n=1 Tax=Albidovulum inexpectatum TaxID=196587 RepID=A0A2S5JLI9_9RHOB|nr:hypothetical protein [Albidovulum inexpectatum]PPB82283.1 hypothetical protein LV82_00210 [Albidovulum inexpectatum]